MQISKLWECEATDAQKLFLSEKKLLNAILRASKNTNSCFSAISNYENARPQMLKNFFLSEKKLLNAILEQSSSTWKMFLSNEMNIFLQCRRQFFMSLSFFAEKSHFRAEMHKLTSLELLRTPILCFSANKQIMRMRGHRCSKTSFSVRKVANAILRAKLKHMKNVSF